MSRAVSFGAVILAAGESSRMGRDKALLPWPPQDAASPPTETFLSAAIQSLAPSSDFVIVVAGRNESSLSPIAYINGAAVITNPDPSRGQFSSLQLGLSEVLNRGRDAAIVTLVDRPPARTTTVQALRDFFELAPREVWAVVPDFSGKHGHPYIAGREMIEEFLDAPSTSNAREVEHRVQKHIQYLTVDDAFVALNINTPEDYAALLIRSR